MQPDNTNKALRKPKLANKKPMYSLNTNSSGKCRFFKDRGYKTLNSQTYFIYCGSENFAESLWHSPLMALE